MSPIIKRANRLKVSPDLLSEVVVMNAELPPAERRSFEIRSIRLIQFLTAKGLSKPDLMLAIDFRLTAMAAFADADDLRGWVMTGSPVGPDYVHDEFIRAAAEEPLIETENGPGFNPETFRTRLLRISETRGRG